MTAHPVIKEDLAVITGCPWMPQQERKLRACLMKCRCLLGDQRKNLDLSAQVSLEFNKLSGFVLVWKCTLALPDCFLDVTSSLGAVCIPIHSVTYLVPCYFAIILFIIVSANVWDVSSSAIIRLIKRTKWSAIA